MKVLDCGYCGAPAHHEWGDGAGESYRVECSASYRHPENDSGCKQWPRIYAETKTHAINMWNIIMSNLAAHGPIVTDWQSHTPKPDDSTYKRV